VHYAVHNKTLMHKRRGESYSTFPTPFAVLLTSYMTRAMLQVNFFCINKINIKILGLFVKLYPRVLGLISTADPKVIFIILIITLNLHDLSLSDFGCNTRPNSLGCGSGCKVVP